MAAQKVLPTLVFAVLFGLSLAKIGDLARPAIGLMEAVLGAMFKLTNWIVATSPVAIVGLVAWLSATQGGKAILGLAKMIDMINLSPRSPRWSSASSCCCWGSGPCPCSGR